MSETPSTPPPPDTRNDSSFLYIGGNSIPHADFTREELLRMLVGMMNEYDEDILAATKVINSAVIAKRECQEYLMDLYSGMFPVGAFAGEGDNSFGQQPEPTKTTSSSNQGHVSDFGNEQVKMVSSNSLEVNNKIDVQLQDESRVDLEQVSVRTPETCQIVDTTSPIPPQTKEITLELDLVAIQKDEKMLNGKTDLERSEQSVSQVSQQDDTLIQPKNGNHKEQELDKEGSDQTKEAAEDTIPIDDKQHLKRTISENNSGSETNISITSNPAEQVVNAEDENEPLLQELKDDSTQRRISDNASESVVHPEECATGKEIGLTKPSPKPKAYKKSKKLSKRKQVKPAQSVNEKKQTPLNEKEKETQKEYEVRLVFYLKSQTASRQGPHPLGGPRLQQLLTIPKQINRWVNYESFLISKTKTLNYLKKLKNQTEENSDPYIFFELLLTLMKTYELTIFQDLAFLERNPKVLSPKLYMRVVLDYMEDMCDMNIRAYLRRQTMHRMDEDFQDNFVQSETEKELMEAWTPEADSNLQPFFKNPYFEKKLREHKALMKSSFDSMHFVIFSEYLLKMYRDYGKVNGCIFNYDFHCLSMANDVRKDASYIQIFTELELRG